MQGPTRGCRGHGTPTRAECNPPGTTNVNKKEKQKEKKKEKEKEEDRRESGASDDETNSVDVDKRARNVLRVKDKFAKVASAGYLVKWTMARGDSVATSIG